MGTDTPKNPTDELIKCYRKLRFPSGDLDDLIFGTVELKKSEKQPDVNPKAPK